MGLQASALETDCGDSSDTRNEFVASLEELADEALRQDAFEYTAKKYGVQLPYVSVDLSLEESSFEDEYYSSTEIECETRLKRHSGNVNNRDWVAGEGSLAGSYHYMSSPPQARDFTSSPFRWQKGSLIGSGSFGRVFLGLNLETGEMMAIKQVELALDKLSDQRSEIKSLHHEIEVLKELKHENIVQYLGSSVEGNEFNIFLEYVPGGSITSIINRFGPLPEHLIRIYTKQILQGLQYLHNHKIIHRDIKGANILVDNKGVIKLADFGACKKLKGLVSSLETNSLKGTVYWMAPEVLRQAGCGRQADIWSLGCTIIEMAMGKPPWFGEFTEQVSALFHIATSTEPPKIPSSLSPALKDFLRLCFQRNPKDRPNARKLLSHPFVALASPVDSHTDFKSHGN